MDTFIFISFHYTTKNNNDDVVDTDDGRGVTYPGVGPQARPKFRHVAPERYQVFSEDVRSPFLVCYVLNFVKTISMSKEGFTH